MREALTATRSVRREKLDLRLTAKAKKTLKTAAAAADRSVSEFVLESALARAEETLADRRKFELEPARWAQFLEALDRSPRPVPRMAQLLREPGFFDETPSR